MRNCIIYNYKYNSITLETFIAFRDQSKYLIPLKVRFNELNENDKCSLDDYKNLEEDIEKSEIDYCHEEQNTLVYYIIIIYYFYCRKRLTNLQTDAKYSDIMTQSCNLFSRLPKAQNILLQCIGKCNNKDCPVNELKEAIMYIQQTINKLEMRKRAKDIKDKLIGFLYVNHLYFTRYDMLRKNLITDETEKQEINSTITTLTKLTPYDLNEEELNDKYNHYQEKYTKINLTYEFEKELYKSKY